ncbi:hypothetical protein ECANGB1_2084 [Enterospora canceri]|uniref:Uncharacterized protein n=1 Tax=Enterospora canceri TaxID=1081671 RepID=A0A1Y1S8V9_9MICR|nr:hypothetical protein ECANGB1_2084 [Enterospora canceri]
MTISLLFRIIRASASLELGVGECSNVIKKRNAMLRNGIGSLEAELAMDESIVKQVNQKINVVNGIIEVLNVAKLCLGEDTRMGLYGILNQTEIDDLIKIKTNGSTYENKLMSESFMRKCSIKSWCEYVLSTRGGLISMLSIRENLKKESFERIRQYKNEIQFNETELTEFIYTGNVHKY